MKLYYLTFSDLLILYYLAVMNCYFSGDEFFNLLVVMSYDNYKLVLGDPVKRFNNLRS